jgi:hypothetical protein
MEKQITKKAIGFINLFAITFKKYSVVALALLLVSILSAVRVEPVDAQTSHDQYTQEARVQVKQLDERAKLLQAYLADRNSPLQDNAQDFIDAADKYNIDWKLLPAISGVESSFGVAQPEGSHNGWGWGGSDLVYFGSWKDAIYTIDESLKTRYHVAGNVDPYEIGRTYAASPTWGVRVDGFMRDIDAYVKLYQGTNYQPKYFPDRITVQVLLTKKVPTCYNLDCVTNNSGHLVGQTDLSSN